MTCMMLSAATQLTAACLSHNSYLTMQPECNKNLAAQNECHAHIVQALVMLHGRAAAHGVLALNVSHVKGVIMCTP